MAEQLLNKVAVVTGAGGVLGRAIVERLIAEGAKVVVFGRNRGRLEELAGLAPARIVVVEGDVTRAADLASLVQTTVRRFGGVDILVCAAAVFRGASVVETTPELVSELLAVNLLGSLETLRTFARNLNAAASVVFLTASPEHAARGGCGAFSASKAALASLAQTAAVELASRKVRVNCVAPRPFETQEVLSADPESVSEERTPQLRRRAAEIADATLFLASSASAGITGQQLVVG
jgi:NAD(P)-dependent dehydrogenase (short-subunit alcohol dehydrogenase family)